MVAAALSFALAAVLLHALARFALKAFLYLRSPYSRDYGEGCILAMVQLLDERGTYFMDLHGYPYVHLNYPPVFPVLVWPLYRWLGPTLWVPRLLSLLATVGFVAVVYAIARRLGNPPAWATALAGVALCPWFVQTWAPLARVDMLAIFFSAAGLLAFTRGARLGTVFALFWLAFFTKQNALLAPAAVLLHLAVSGPPRRFAAAFAGFALPLAALFGLLVLATDGEAYRHLVTYTAAAGFDWSRLGKGYGDLVRVAWPLLLVLGFGLVARRRAGPAEDRAGALWIYWGLSVAGLATIAKEGAVQNYYVEPWAATVLAGAAALPLLGERLGSTARVAILLLAAAVAHYTQNWAHRLPHAIAHPDQDAGFRRLWEVVRETEGPILSENLAVLVLNRRPVLVEPFGLLTLSRAGLLRKGPIVRDCEKGVFEVVVVEGLLEGVPILRECLEQHYRVSEDLPPYKLLRPVD
ncbi:MAG TPA: glycosyltransferase family 39 protein [Vicinamibacteria bacterium]